MSNQVTERAKLDGLVYNFDKSLVANSFKAHRFSHFAKKFGKQGEAEELLFKAYFTDGKNIDSDQTLIELALELNLDTQELSGVLTSDEYTQDVLSDIEEAQHIGVRGVPFFVFNRKYAISGAQDSQLFLETLMKSADL